MKRVVYFSSEVESTVYEYQFTGIEIVIVIATVSTQSVPQILHCQFLCSPCKTTEKSGEKKVKAEQMTEL